MHWHIITGSKGGVGKTLLTLLLLEYHLERKPKEGILVLDLNAMNTDTSAMLMFEKAMGTSVLMEKNAQEITFQKVYSLDDDKKSRCFIVGWPKNPFILYDTEKFPKLLVTIKEFASELTKKLELPPLQHVIIDTNYHFCSLFPRMKEHLDKSYIEGDLKDDLFTIWFLWVYRQLDRFQKGDGQATLIKEIVGTIEDKLMRTGGIGPIVHTYTPVGLLSVEPDQQKWWSGLFGGQTDTARRDVDHPFKELIALEKLPVSEYIKFEKWMEKLQQAHTVVENVGKDDPHRFFLKILDEAVRQLAEFRTDSTLPINIFPLSVYQSALEGYTDKERSDMVAALRKTTLYKNFAKLLDRKYESLHL